MAGTTPVAGEERKAVSFRFPTGAIDLIDRAAALLHQDRTAFVVEAALARAQAVLLDRTVFLLPEAEYEAFLAALDDPPEPNERLKALARRVPVWSR